MTRGLSTKIFQKTCPPPLENTAKLPLAIPPGAKCLTRLLRLRNP